MSRPKSHDVARLIAATERLRDATAGLAFGAPITHVYNPLAYAWAVHRLYLERYAGRGARLLLLGMNPGPFGMAQSGVPFGDVGIVTQWFGLSGPVERPDAEHPKRPVIGLGCTRGEVSGRRLWGWARDRFRTPEAFFDRFFVWNYCPLSFMEATGRNRTPDKLPADERARLYAPCDVALREVIDVLQLTHVIGIGRFARERAAALDVAGVRVGAAPHPSPANPAANRGWAPLFEAALHDLGVWPPDETN
jgi:single-strand selective monofunctional uracil DNA glycosylase